MTRSADRDERALTLLPNARIFSHICVPVFKSLQYDISNEDILKCHVSEIHWGKT